MSEDHYSVPKEDVTKAKHLLDLVMAFSVGAILATILMIIIYALHGPEILWVSREEKIVKCEDKHYKLTPLKLVPTE